MNTEVKIIEDSISPDGVRLTTFQLKYPRYILAEVNTHRVFSRSTSSSRAIPIKKIISQVWNTPVIPQEWSMNNPGMQSNQELSGFRKILAEYVWISSSKIACGFAYLFHLIGLHKQYSNRVLEPWMIANTVVTATEWDNFWKLRDHPDAQPDIQLLAKTMREEYTNNIPKLINYEDWHLPYITDEEKTKYGIDLLLKMSTARCARVSYNNHDGTSPNIEKDLELHKRLVESKPEHASPTEHQAKPVKGNAFYKNFRGWYQYRHFVEE